MTKERDCAQLKAVQIVSVTLKFTLIVYWYQYFVCLVGNLYYTPVPT
jgi:hypothetical protein